MEIPSSIAELAHFVGGEVVFVDVCDGARAFGSRGFRSTSRCACSKRTRKYATL